MANYHKDKFNLIGRRWCECSRCLKLVAELCALPLHKQKTLSNIAWSLIIVDCEVLLKLSKPSPNYKEATKFVSASNAVNQPGSSISYSRDTEGTEDGDVDRNGDECRLCGMDGILLCCDGCPSAYHSRCIVGLMGMGFTLGTLIDHVNEVFVPLGESNMSL